MDQGLWFLVHQPHSSSLELLWDSWQPPRVLETLLGLFLSLRELQQVLEGLDGVDARVGQSKAHLRGLVGS